MDTPDQGAPPHAPTPASPVKSSVDVVLNGVKELLPAVSVAVALPLLIVFTMPASNEKAVLALIAGLLGFLTGRATAPKGPAQ